MGKLHMGKFMVLTALVLSACGRSSFVCSQVFDEPVTRMFGPNEVISCPHGENLVSARMEYHASGQPNHALAECSKVKVSCE